MRGHAGIARRSVIIAVVVGALITSCASPAPDGERHGRAFAESQTRALAAKSVGAPAAVDREAAFVDATIAEWSLEQLLASLIMVAAPGSDPEPVRRLVDAHQLGGFIVMGSNVPGSVDQVADFVSTLSANPALPVLVAVDQEGADVRRLPGDTFGAGRTLHGAGAGAVEEAFRERAALVAGAGIPVNFGIVADVTDNSRSFIFGRTLGTTPRDAAERVAAAVRGEREHVYSTLKHFPGHGASPDDSHVSIPTSTIDADAWRATHAEPFRAGIDAGAPLVMTGHLLFPQISADPASLSAEWVSILRTELGFTGVIVTDDLLMLQRSGIAEYADPYANAVRALAAGNDLLLFVLPGDPQTVGVDVATLIDRLAAAVAAGDLAHDSVEASARRVLELRRGASDVPAPSCGPPCDRVSVRSEWRAP